MKVLEETIGVISSLDEESILRTKKRLDTRMKPVGSLGKLEEVAIQFSGITGRVLNKADRRCHIVASADNGVIDEGVSSCPIEYTRIVSEAMLNNIAAIGILCKTLNVDFKCVDIGIKDSIKGEYENLYNLKVASGTRNLAHEAAMTREECVKAIEKGIEFIGRFKDDYDIFSNGEMGIANTTTSSAVLYALTKASIDDVVGRGGGLSDEGLIKKKRIVSEAVDRDNLFEVEPLEVLRHVGGLDISFMVGLYLGCARYKKPILIDGFISGVAALVAAKMVPNARGYMIATHRSEEPGMTVILDELEMKPMLSMNMRLGEGTGAVFAYPIISGALEVVKGMKEVKEVYELFN